MNSHDDIRQELHDRALITDDEWADEDRPILNLRTHPRMVIGHTQAGDYFYAVLECGHRTLITKHADRRPDIGATHFCQDCRMGRK